MTEVPPHAVSSQAALAISVVSSFTATPIRSALEFWADHLGIAARLSFAPYGQVFQELQKHGHGARPAPESVAVLLRMEDFVLAGGRSRAASVAEELAATISAAGQRSPATTFLLAVCPPSPAVGNDRSRLRLVEDATQVLCQQACTTANVLFVEPSDVLLRYQVSRYEDSYADFLGNIPYTPQYFVALGTTLMRRIYRMLAPEPKVLVVDGDNTLWDGVLGEDGLSGVEIGSARQEMHELLITQRRAGRILCLCTKNDPAEVEAALAAIPGRRLQRDDFVHVRANWLPKSENVRELASDLGLALDTFIFIDDSPLECAEMRRRCPEVATLQLPSDSSRALQAIQHFWPLDIGEITPEAAARTVFYQQDQQRREQRRHGELSLSEFIDSLELEVTIRPAGTTDHARIADLVRRTTQFNLTGERYSEAEIEALPDSIERWVVDLRDRFGTYGTVGVMLFSTADGALTVTTFLLSCRALGRGVEHRMLAHLGQVAVTQGLGEVRLRFAATARNQPARQFLDEVAVPRDQATATFATYVLGVRDAAGLRYFPDDAPAAEPAVTVPETTGRSAGDDRPRSRDDVGGITAELTTADSILKAIRHAAEDGIGHDDRADDERFVIRIWAEILNVSPANVDRDFRALGGGSLEIVELLARVYGEFGIELPIDALLDNTFTVGSVVAMIRLFRMGGGGCPEGGIPWVES